MSGKAVPSSGNISLRTAPASASNAIFEVFGVPASSNLLGLRSAAYNTTTRPPTFTQNTIPSSGNLSMSSFAGTSKYLTSPTTVAMTNLYPTSIVPSLAGGGGTSYYVAVGTSAGTSNVLGWTAATNGGSITQAFTAGTSYYISAYTSNASSNTSSLAVSNSTAYIPVANPTSFTVNSISNTSFTAQAAGSTGATGYNYYLYNVTGQYVVGGVQYAAVGVSTVFTGLSTNIQYLVIAYGVTSNTVCASQLNSATIWCLAPATSVIISNYNPIGNITWSWINNSPSGATSVTLSVSGTSAVSLTYGTFRSTGTPSSTIGPSSTNFTYISNTLSTFAITTNGTNTSAVSSNVNFVGVMPGLKFTFTPSISTTMKLWLWAGAGGWGSNLSQEQVGQPGMAGNIVTTFTSVANSPINCYTGQAGTGALVSGQTYSKTALCGDGTIGGNGGRGYYEPAGPGSVGGYSGGGGAASAFFTSGIVIIAGGGGGGGISGVPGIGGDGGVGASGGTGGDGYSYALSLLDTETFHTGGYGGGGGVGGAGGASGKSRHGDGYPGTNTTGTGTSTTALGNGGNGVPYAGDLAGGGGGGYGGGGGGDAVNDNGGHLGGGGAGGGSYSSVGGTFSSVNSGNGGGIIISY